MLSPEQFSKVPDSALRISRRLFIDLSLRAAVGLAAATQIPGLFLPKKAWANESWQDGEWGPLDSEVARRNNLITYYSDGGPLEKFDKLQQFFLGENSNLKQQLAAFATDYLSKYGGTSREWAGFCHGLAHLMLGPQPIKEPEVFTLDNGEAVTVTYTDRIALGALFHSGDIMYRPILGDNPTLNPKHYIPENLDAFRDYLAATGTRFVVNAPERGQEGSWYRVVANTEFLASNFNTPDKEWINIERDLVKEVYYPLSWKEAQASGIDKRLFAEIPGDWRWDNRMNEPLYRRLVFNE